MWDWRFYPSVGIISAIRPFSLWAVLIWI